MNVFFFQSGQRLLKEPLLFTLRTDFSIKPPLPRAEGLPTIPRANSYRLRVPPSGGNRRGGVTVGIADTALLAIDIPIDLIASFQVEGVSQIGYF